MYTRKIELDPDCGIFLAMQVLGGKWKCCILDAVGKGISRPSDIARYMPDAAARVIEMQLAELLAFGMVERFTEDVYPKRSTYKLTALGETMLPILASIDKWGIDHADLIKERMGMQAAKAV
ncbi:helix-turn-helix domain-containing protein [Chitinophaga sp. Cy-1792]|uniref:winged helix-turn-helix transcriptional regulator n=1 Tax=Chitinophaga sp. Cy-1792 TaxID=2608339 RepID=UPI00142494BE|nr:helix-turn-helix domain-containing protein [Chitinophaga sp. Cy-1792]NIG55751.1 helix-turn-helix transcriptional regulator [Chitinophaga sp. Cy-1792]